MRDTLYVNIFGGPGISKSTQAALVFGLLKTKGYLAEYVQEFAKDLVWEGRHEVLGFQPYITAKQIWRQERLRGKVDVVITDSPILLGLVYSTGKEVPCFQPYVIQTFNAFKNLNFLLVRNPGVHKFYREGRNQEEEEAVEVDEKILALLDFCGIVYSTVPIEPGISTAESIVSSIQKHEVANHG